MDNKKTEWDEIRKPFLAVKDDYLKKSCKNCVWSERMCDVIFCSKACKRKKSQ